MPGAKLGSMEKCCGLCGEPLGAGGGRTAGLDLCLDCWQAVEEGPLAARGLCLTSRRWSQTVSTGKTTVTYHYVELTGRLPQPSGLALRLTRERVFHKVLKLFSRELQVGDPLFDDVVYVGGKARPGDEALLCIPGFQDVILEIVSENGWVEIGDSTIKATRMLPTSDADDTPLRRAALVATHLLARHLSAPVSGRTSEGS